MDELLHRGRLVADDVAGDDAAEGFELPLDFAGRRVAFDFVGRQPQPHGPGVGQVGQLQVGRQGAFPRRDPLGEHRLGQSGRNHRAVDDLPQGEAGFQTRHHLVLHQVLHFEGYARERDDDVPVAFEPHARGRAVGVEEHRAARGDHRLRAVQLVEVDAAFGEHPLDVRGHPFVVAHVAAEQFGERLFGDVVLRGAQAARDDRHLRHAERPLHGAGNLRAVVADRDFFADDDARGVEVLGDGYGVRVHDLAYEDFVADRENGRFHIYSEFQALVAGSCGRRACCAVVVPAAASGRSGAAASVPDGVSGPAEEFGPAGASDAVF